MSSDHELILIAGLLLAVGLAAAKVADRVRVPGLLLFLGLGMLIGSEGLGGVDFSDAELTRTLGTIGLVLILFEGGLTAGWNEIRPVLGTAVSLATVGTIGTAVVSGVAATWLFDLDLLEGLIVGGAIAATDSAAIFAVLRGSRLRRRVARALEGESGLNDPVALLLVVGFIDWIEMPDYGAVDMAFAFVGKLALGVALGVVIGLAARCGDPPARPPEPGPVPGRLDRRRRDRLRPARAGPRLRLPRRLHRRLDPRHRAGPGTADDDRVPPGALVGRPDLALRPPRPARVPQRPRRGRTRGADPLGRADPRRTAAGDAGRDGVRARTSYENA